MKYDEKDFESLIDESLRESGFDKRSSDCYDKDSCVDRDTFLDFLKKTQEKELGDLQTRAGERWKNELFSRLDKAISEKSLAAVIKDGFSASGVNFRIAYRKPDNAQNPATLADYAQNICSFMRQVHFSPIHSKESLDMVIFLNGIAVFSVELKNHFTGQNVQNAIEQYKGRNRSDKIFKPNRLIAHFAVDNDEVFVCTALRGKDSEFLPFNRGLNDGNGDFRVQTGAGNPAESGKMKSAYFWEKILQKDTLIRVLFDFVQVQESKLGRIGSDSSGEGKRVIFPRYHQFDLVDKLVRACAEKGAGQRFLIQHSAGSGKSNSIAYLAHQLTGLRDTRGELVFNSVIVVTDRRVLDRQINDTVRGMSHTQGVIEHADKSRDLKKALENDIKIIISTIQKFPFVVKEIRALGDKRFAIIIDEAHSSQGGENAAKMSAAISKGESVESYEDIQERILETIKAEKLQENASYFAFTATPKASTLEMFGEKLIINGEEKFIPFHLYSMKQAIEEGFILDVLRHYITYKSFYQIIKTTQENPHYDKNKAKSKIRRYVEGDPRTIEKKAEIMIDYFLAHSQHQIGGKAKAMVVTSSRQNALKYYCAFNAILKEWGLQESHKALIAFSGDLNDGGETHSESKLNGFSEAALPAEFKKDENRFLIVAEKYQTGFDEPLLHTMYVDKKLSGINAVQTLSRLNRKCAGKVDTCVLDFANDTGEIEKAFSGFYETTYLREASDINNIFDLRDSLLGFRVYTQDWAVEFLEAVARGESANTLHARLDCAVQNFTELDQEQKEDFYKKARNFVKAYGFLRLILPFEDMNLEANFVWLRFLLDKLPQFSAESLSKEFLENIDLQSYKIRRESEGSIALQGDGELSPSTADGTKKPESEEQALSEIVREINERFGDIDFGDGDKLAQDFKQIRDEIFSDDGFRRAIINTDEQTTKRQVGYALDRKTAKIYDINEKIYTYLAEKPEFKAFFIDKIFKEMIRSDLMSHAHQTYL